MVENNKGRANSLIDTRYVVTYTACLVCCVGRDSAVGIETRYGLDGPVMESRWGGLSALLQTGPGVHPTSYTTGTGSLSQG
jgi:hypothetical protein